MVAIRLLHISKQFSLSEAVSNITLEVEEGEFLVLVGPSGCGKTTLLRMIAGLEEISSGELYLGDVLANALPAGDRDIAMVFQNFALFPHMTVFDNIAFSLQGGEMPQAKIEQRVLATAELLSLTPFLKRLPHELSGGQRQQVALGHAIVRQPAILLLDEPLLYLDVHVRMQTRTELRRLHQRLQYTTLYVTHDQAEAMALGDRLAVMNHGVLQQVGTPGEVYRHPANQFVASFIGSPTMNFFPNVMITREGSSFKAQIASQIVPIPQRFAHVIGQEEQHLVTLGLRPEDLTVTSTKELGVLQGVVDLIEQSDNEQILYIDIGKSIILARTDIRTRRRVGDTVGLVIEEDKLHAFDPETTTTIL